MTAREALEACLDSIESGLPVLREDLARWRAVLGGPDELKESIVQYLAAHNELIFSTDRPASARKLADAWIAMNKAARVK